MSNLSDRGTLRGTLQRNSGNYNDLINKPAINGHTLIGNQSGHALGLANEDDIIYVEANPLGPATADLHKILVDDTIYSIPDVVVYGNASGDIASFDDGGNDKPLKSLKVAINPVQASGTPSPSNPLPISGWTGANIIVKGKNLIGGIDVANRIKEKFENNATINSENKTVAFYPSAQQGYPSLLYNAKAITTGETPFPYYYPFKENTQYTFIFKASSLPTTSLNIGVSYTDGTNNGGFKTTQADENGFIIWTSPADKTILSFYVGKYTLTTTLYYDTVGVFEGVVTLDDFVSYNTSNLYEVTWSEAGEVFGGTLDVTNGKLKARPYYASYNGETLIGPWISSMDVYTPNTPPTTGAQVVDLGGIETEIDISPTQITTLLGSNNIWSDTGDIEECVYQRDINIALNKALNQ